MESLPAAWELVRVLLKILKPERYKIMKSKFREKFGGNAKNFTNEKNVHMYPVKTLVTKGKCKNGKNKNQLVFRRAKDRDSQFQPKNLD